MKYTLSIVSTCIFLLLTPGCGMFGADGQDGADGAPGAPGAQGPAGPQGEPGPPGKDGVNGTPGGASGGSGSRLKARHWSAADGASLPTGDFTDLTFNEPCVFRVASDGVRRCLPVVDNAYTLPMYADPSCTTPIAAFDETCEMPYKHAVRRIYGSCSRDMSYDALQLGALLPTPQNVWFRTAPGPQGCVGQQGSDVLTYYQIAAIMEPADFVGADIAQDP